jgi:2-amino-4-hydroxy-6-hydroxymethyldihydropteridine diphosphokinase
MPIVYISIGTNMGDREQNLSDCTALVSERIGKIVKESSIYETEPWGFEADQDFLNMVLKIDSQINDPLLLLKKLKGIEGDLGRGPKIGSAYQSRMIDLDILFFGEMFFENEELQIPHPRLQDRNFVLAPLFEISPDWQHGKFKQSISDLYKECKDVQQVKIYS